MRVLLHFFVLLLHPLLIYFQADYVLGKNPMKMSYLVGYGSDYPQYVHHRGSSIPVDFDSTAGRGLNGLILPIQIQMWLLEHLWVDPS